LYERLAQVLKINRICLHFVVDIRPECPHIVVIETDTQGTPPMYDFSIPAEAPGTCPKCKGTGAYSWGGSLNGKAIKSGTCFSCSGTGQQDSKQIRRNHAYNRFKISQIAAA
jgi:hypothetical protein